jgi:hypothetical protein
MQQAGGSRDRFPMESLRFFIDLIFMAHDGPKVEKAS